jgi:hypothetical protein
MQPLYQSPWKAEAVGPGGHSSASPSVHVQALDPHQATAVLDYLSESRDEAVRVCLLEHAKFDVARLMPVLLRRGCRCVYLLVACMQIFANASRVRLGSKDCSAAVVRSCGWVRFGGVHPLRLAHPREAGCAAGATGDGVSGRLDA